MKLAPLTRQDCEQVRQWRNEDLAFLRTPYFLTEEMQADFYDTVINNRDSKHKYFALYEMVHLKLKQEVASFGEGYKTEMFIGMVGLTNIEWENGVSEISLIISPKYRGHGQGRRALSMILGYGFNNLRLETITFEVYHCGSIGFWRKMAEERKAYSVELIGRKMWDGKLYGSDWIAFERSKYYENIVSD